jgi:site-specific recombinase XerD
MIQKQTRISDLVLLFEGELRKHGYSEDSLRRYRKVFRELIEFSGNSFYTQKVCTDFLVDRLKLAGGFFTAGASSKNQMYYLRTIRSLTDYHNFGTIFRRKDIGEFIIWPKPFRKPIEDYLATLISRKLAPRYIRHNEHVFRDFIIYLDACEVSSYAEIAAQHISGFVSSLVGFSPKAISSKLSILRGFLRFVYLEEIINISLADVLPKVHCLRTTLPTVWTSEEIQKILETVDRGSPTGKRNYAMILLVARLGMRIGDVKDLKLTDIDWLQNCIHIRQNKTGNPLTLPLLSDVGWAIIEYLKTGRPITDCENVFIRHNPPFVTFASSTCLHGMISALISKSGIPAGNRQRTGIYSLRHSLASGLLQNKVEINIISEILGHSNPESVSHYIRVDLSALRQCALNVKYTLNVEVEQNENQ